MHGTDVHIEGMGVLGTLLAAELGRRGVDFTWHDTEEKVNAWAASTGCIYPGGDTHDEACHANWLRWATFRGFYTEPATYWYNHVHPPHGGRYEHVTDLGWLRQAGPPSVHFNAQAAVEACRAHNLPRRLPGPNEAARHYVVAHGFGDRLEKYVWGWTVPVRLALPDELVDDVMRPALYLRKGRFVMCYAYPRPGTQEWYAGSSLIVQREAKELDPEKHYARWLRWLDELTGGRVSVSWRGEALQGWRPRGPREQGLEVQQDGNRLLLPPMWHNGIRHFPVVLAQVLQKLGAL